MFKPFKTCSAPLPYDTNNETLHALQDYLEMRADLPAEKTRGLLAQIRHQLVLSGEIQPLAAFMVGTQAVLCLKEEAPEAYWIYNPKKECLHAWKKKSRVPEAVL